MSTRQDGPKSQAIASRDELVAYFEAGAKPPSEWRIGTEHEKFGFLKASLAPLAYAGPEGVRAILEGLVQRFGYRPVMEGGNIIALRSPPGVDRGTVSLEPGGQLELSGAPLTTLHETAAELDQHLDEMKAVGEALGIGMLGLGFSPLWSRAETPTMPKGRYKIMTAYMPKVGRLGLDMMYRSATVQVNLDFESEADMVKKLRVGLALQPVVAAMAANSPFTEGKPNGYLSFRSEVWRHTDPDRTGMLPFAFEPGMGYERYVDYVLDVPMYFVYREGAYIDASGQSFRDFLAGRLPALPGERPDMEDWADHISTAFPEVRLKRFLEMRGADAGGRDRTLEVPALWVGLLYDRAALDAAYDLVKAWSAEERQALRDAVPKLALGAQIGGRAVAEIAAQVLDIADGGLARRARTDGAGVDERVYLDGFRRLLEDGKTNAERLLERYHGRWQGDVRHVFAEEAI
ncbi:MAG: glutamate--cysteine ligase [Hyphomicrobiaceae bacterium]